MANDLIIFKSGLEGFLEEAHQVVYTTIKTEQTQHFCHTIIVLSAYNKEGRVIQLIDNIGQTFSSDVERRKKHWDEAQQKLKKAEAHLVDAGGLKIRDGVISSLDKPVRGSLSL